MRAVISLTALLSLAAMSVAQTTINVGAIPSATGGPYQFSPSNITASNGTVITFVWSGIPGNHSVTQSSFANPCQPVSGGFDSGFLFIPAGTTTGFPSWNITITDDSTPIYFYCGQLLPVPHCTAGMVGSINAPTEGSGSYSAFSAAAIALNGTTPGTPVPNLVGIGASASVLPGPFSGNETGFALPAGPTASNASPIAGSATSSASGVASSSASAGASSAASSAPSPAASPSGAVFTSVNVAITFIAALFGVALTF